MFNAKQHLTLFLTYSVVFLLPFPTDILHFLLGGLVGSLLPDVDHKNSIAGHIIPLWLIFKHGRETHTLLTASIFIVIYYYTNLEIFYGIWFGYMTHLTGDNLQGNNLKYLYFPFKRNKKFRK